MSKTLIKISKCRIGRSWMIICIFCLIIQIKTLFISNKLTIYNNNLIQKKIRHAPTLIDHVYRIKILVQINFNHVYYKFCDRQTSKLKTRDK